ncbi:non-homologous end-joining DNA ligase [Actinotalea sp. M2MS4P-6]|uniref:non-homologous end-joining DNA ligase n=1 Tax=Actinotalea sp. M2MS4P-6 TaxID=2983762 RepID=UPI0021E3C27F|nr:non-homologous end-joining DNA ligase [Actinotalea sp. M2MS4P-6]MCV2393797.1 non-homologous end-joining DNA ligase [Actinotalea sp. M2MS4P-6]
MAEEQWVDVEGRRVRLSNLSKVLWPATGTTKGEMLHYYSQVAPAILRQLADRPVTRVRYPDGVEAERFFEKNVPAGTPDWVRHHALPASPGAPDDPGTEGTVVDLPVLDGLPALIWVANLGAVELHTPQWRVGPRGGVHPPDRLVVDLDPGPGAGLADCARAAHLIADRLATDGLDQTVPVTSGSKGMQLYATLDGRRSAADVHGYAKDLARELARAHPDLLVADQKRTLRPGKVLLDWSQNHPAKTTITPYSMRGREHPTVAAPRTWDEVGPGLRQLEWDEVLDRLADVGDLMP